MSQQTEAPPNTLILKSPFTGSNRQLIALGKLLNTTGTVACERITLRTNSYLFKFAARQLANHFKQHPPSNWIKRLTLGIFFKQKVPHSGVRLIIAKRATYEHTLLLLSYTLQCKSLYIGSPRKTSGLFDYVVSTPSTPAPSPDIELDYLPTTCTYEEYSKIKSRHDSSKTVWAVLLGGDAKGMTYSLERWQQMIDSILKLAKCFSAKCVITTSPRSPQQLDSLVHSHLSKDNTVTHEFHPYNDKDTSQLQSLLARSSFCILTEDSAAMLSDAANCRLPTLSIRPAEDCYNTLSTPQAIHLEKKRAIIRATADSLNQQQIKDFLSNKFTPIASCWSEKIRREYPEILNALTI